MKGKADRHSLEGFREDEEQKEKNYFRHNGIVVIFAVLAFFS
jgi:hypothetical protein